MFDVPEGSQPTLARGELRQRLPALRDLTLAVEWAFPELEFEDVRGVVGEPLRDGEERRRAGACAGLAATLSSVTLGSLRCQAEDRGED